MMISAVPVVHLLRMEQKDQMNYQNISLQPYHHVSQAESEALEH